MKTTGHTFSITTILTVATICITLLFGPDRRANADVINMAVDSNLSSTGINIAGVTDSSATSGTLVLDITSTTPPSGSAQITSLNLVLVDGLSYSLVGGFVTGTTAPNDIEITLITPGPAGTIAGSQFDQLGNTFGTSGDVAIVDPLNLVGGNQVLDLSTLAPSNGDFTNVNLSQIGNILTLNVDYEFTQTTALGNVITSGTLVANGIVPVPEPSSLAVSMLLLSGLTIRRRLR